jgi:serine/threonine protein kinase
VGDQAWEAKWSPELEQAWAQGLGQTRDPRASIGLDRRTLPSGPQADSTGGRQRTVSSGSRPPARLPPEGGANVTREFDDGEAAAVRGFAPVGQHRKIPIRVKGDASKLEMPELEIEGEVGSGGMGKVFRARQTSLDRPVALKQLTPHEKLPDSEAHFESEACITAVLDHPNITPVHDMGVDAQGNLFYTMKLIEGTPWDDLLYGRPEGLVQAGPDGRDLRGHLEVLLEVANAVAFAHSRGIIHRDIKPQNVLVGEYGEVLLVDWGLAVALQPIAELPRVFDLTQVLVTCGTPAYMPPEISTGQRQWIGRWTDVFMLGAVLYEVLYGLPPHEESTALDALKVASRNEWVFPAVIHPDLEPYHEVLKPVLQRSLSTHPQDRYQDASDFHDAVKDALAHLDAAELAGDAIHAFRRVESEEATNQQVRKAGSSSMVGDTEAKYRILANSIAVIEQALESWPENPTARHYLVEAHLLFVLIALSADDLSLARSQLNAIDHLPSGIVPADDQLGRAQKLARRLERARDGRERKSRWMRVFQLSAIVLTLALLVGATVATVLIGNARDRARRERNHLSQLLIATASDGIESDLDGLLQPVRAALRATTDWAKAGRLDTDDSAELTSFFLPLIDGYPVVSSVIRADSNGREYMILRTETGWQTRTVEPGTREKTFQKLAPDGTVLETWTEDIDYDPFSRPWYAGARELYARGKTDAEAHDAIAWTMPYTFFTTKEVGITASMRADSPSGREFVLGVDLTLTDLTAYTQKMPESEHGKVFVMTEDDLVLGLPRDERYTTDEARRAAVLTPVQELGDPVTASAVTEWEERGRTENTRFRYVEQGQVWWAGYRRYELGVDRTLWIGVVLPESDFDVPDQD